MAKLNGVEKRAISADNVSDSAVAVVTETITNGAALSVTGVIAGKIIPTNPGWITPQKFKTAFIGKYAIKSDKQSLVQSAINIGIDGIKSIGNIGFDKGQQPTVVCFPDPAMHVMR